MRAFLAMALLALVLPLAAHAQDPHSWAQPDQVVITHLSLDLDMDFQRKQLRGEATLTLDWNKADASQLVLDTSELGIASVRAVAEDGTSKRLAYTLAEPVDGMGSKLTIEAPQQPETVRIAYVTAPTAGGLQWLNKDQTADKKKPFMYSQSESVYARSWIPLQDTPAVRFTFDAHVTAPKGVRVVMGAINDPEHALDGDFSFTQPKAIPSYLMAIAGGDLAVRETGPRSAVYAEPSVVEKAAHEFEDTEQMIETAEKLYGPYRWGRYDILVLPPSFPYGGMENPNVTFATPTVLVGDKSLVSLVAHELAHSWSGNLVTAANWRNIWLNEGFTTYVQGRITEALYGKALADEEALLAIHELQRRVGEMPKNRQQLVPDLRDRGADDSLTAVAYDKGSWFLRTLEQAYGRKVFDAWLKSYFEHFAWHSITSEQMLAYMKTHLVDTHPGKMSWERIQQWVHQPGIPDDAPIPASPDFDAIDAQRKAFLAGDLAAVDIDTEFTEPGPEGKQITRSWNTQEWMYFLDGLPEVTPLDKIKALDEVFHLTGTPNAEIGMRWYAHAIRAGDKDVWQAAGEHMTRIGRLYLTIPLYRALVHTKKGWAYATAVYSRAKAGYHPLTQKAVQRVLAKAGKKYRPDGDEQAAK